MVNPVDGHGMARVVESGRRDQVSTQRSDSLTRQGWPLKRWIDLSLALSFLLLLLPLMILIALVVRLDSPGPAIFRQERIGRNGQRFDILKFRTMADGAPDDHHREYIAAMVSECHDPSAAGPGKQRAASIEPFVDPNITRVGHWLRKASLDELPQLVNVLRGEMSLVGPRPLPPYEVAGLTDWARRRLTVPQGMTGLWQVSGRSALPYIRMLELDIEYVDHWSLWADRCILAKTLKSVAIDWDKTA
jgi:lipopolysaccharide/colanic/teichoic acid biosynthesis glycosyltransferase